MLQNHDILLQKQGYDYNQNVVSIFTNITY